MKPYFETKLGKLYNCDCLEFMKTMEDKSIDLVLTDPPYGLSMDKTMKAVAGMKPGKSAAYKKDYGESDWDAAIPSRMHFIHLRRISKNQIIFGGNYFTEHLPPSRCWVIWDKKTDDKYRNSFADAELAWTSFNKSVRVFRYLWHGMIQKHMGHKISRVHPTQKPDDLIALIIKEYLEEGGVLDPFIGSGTTAVACEKLNRQWIGVEISEKYCEIAAKRINSEASQGKLF